ncbi:hypothetical protein QZH41_002819 [Actinostola sp. cb2023]|nr:hypothetical protein QZH41_002819 [Actinostola sp. cb2023]
MYVNGSTRTSQSKRCFRSAGFELFWKRMLKNVRHISEGHFYGIRVTNKAKNVSLDKKLRTLEACKDAQNHCYRKEEKDLMNTLMRLQKSKEHCHRTDELVRRHAFHHGNQLGKNHSSSGASVVLPLSPGLSSTAVKIPARRHEDPLPVSMEMGSAIHRTTGFIDCVICRLPRSSHVKGTDVCRCEKGPDKGTHHMHPPAFHDDKTRPEFMNAKEKRVLYEKLTRKNTMRKRL